MTSCALRKLWLCVLAGMISAAVPFATTGQTDSDPNPAALAAREKAECIQNLKQIYAAIQAYELRHKDIPNWLSDLVPDFLPDANVLICPVCRRTGKTEERLLADPKISSSYLFEFCPVSLGGKLAHHTRREWKRRQMGLLGSVVPIVRCRNHTPALNLAFDGQVYESPSFWEAAFTNRISAAELTAARLFANDPAAPAKTAAKPPAVRHFPPRDPNAPKELLDLTTFYNAMLTQTWHGNNVDIGNNLTALPTGLQTFGDVKFDIRGIVQLKSKSNSSTNYPSEIKGIQVQQKCRCIHFLHAAAFGKVADEGQQLGSYIIHYATNQMRLELPIVYGQAVRDWHTMPGEAPAKDLKVVWTGENTVSRAAGQSLRLFLTTWTNVVPGFPIESIDFVSSMATPAPFLIAITVEPE